MADAFVPSDDPLVIAGKAYNSRLIVGTGKYASYAQNAAAAEAAGDAAALLVLRAAAAFASCGSIVASASGQYWISTIPDMSPRFSRSKMICSSSRFRNSGRNVFLTSFRSFSFMPFKEAFSSSV